LKLLLKTVIVLIQGSIYLIKLLSSMKQLLARWANSITGQKRSVC